MKTITFTLIVLLSFLTTRSQNRFDIVIDEIMADPSPSVGLPGNEWIELRNTSALAINLQNWRIGDASGQSGPLPAFILKPDSLVIICTSSAVPAMSAFGTTLSVTSFPSLDNDGDLLFLKSSGGKIIHAINYTSAWYQNELKKDGGWTLEMIDTKSPCAGSSNWKASTDTRGGSPGKKNSLDAVNTDNNPPVLKQAYTTDNLTIILVFDEPVDSLSGAAAGNYSASGGLTITTASTLPPLFDKVQLKLATPMAAAIVYTITAANVKDCRGNSSSSSGLVRVGLPDDAAAGDWIINEILFNPRPNAYDYIEFYNNSRKILDASKLYIANRNTSGAVSSIVPLGISPRYIFPGDYIVVTENAGSLPLQYLVKNPADVLEVSSLPSFPDDEGDVIALNFQGAVVDEVKYKDDWHFKLIDNAEGVSLERIDPMAASQNEQNWHSAASTAGYGTPTYKNSQYKLQGQVQAAIEVSPKIFSPDNDGYNDIATIAYRVDEPGYAASITIFDAAGRPVRALVKSSSLGLTGSWNWDGIDDKGNKLPIGTYIIFTEIFNLEGKKQQFKNALTLARKL